MLSELAASSPAAFMCHYYNFYFAHTAGGRMIGQKVSQMALEGWMGAFYQWEGDVKVRGGGCRISKGKGSWVGWGGWGAGGVRLALNFSFRQLRLERGAPAAGGGMEPRRVSDPAAPPPLPPPLPCLPACQALLEAVRGKLNSTAEGWSEAERAACLEETASTFQWSGQLLQLINGGGGGGH